MKRVWFGITAALYFAFAVFCFSMLSAPKSFAVVWLYPAVFQVFGNVVLCFHKTFFRRFGIVVSILGILNGASPFLMFGFVFFDAGIIPFIVALALGIVSLVICIKHPVAEADEK